ncbi:MAG: hypothetical protein WDO56_30130 [Gammaproteobacteria bacterium]
MSVDGKSMRALFQTVPSQDSTSATTLGTHSTVEAFEASDEIPTVPLASAGVAIGKLEKFKGWTWEDLARHVEALIVACEKGGMRNTDTGRVALNGLNDCLTRVKYTSNSGVELKDLFQSKPAEADSAMADARNVMTDLLDTADKVLNESKEHPSLQRQPIWKAAATVVVGLLLTAGFAALSFLTFGASTLIAALAFGAIIAVGVSGSTLGGAYHHFERKNAEFVDLMRHAVPDLRAAFVAVPREESDHVQMNNDAGNGSSVQQPVVISTGDDGHNSGNTVLTGVDGEDVVNTEVPQPQPESQIFESINLNSFNFGDLDEAPESSDGKKGDNQPV